MMFDKEKRKTTRESTGNGTVQYRLEVAMVLSSCLSYLIFPGFDGVTVRISSVDWVDRDSSGELNNSILLQMGVI